MAKYQVLVKPGSSQEKIIVQDDVLVVYLRAKPHDGEANDALVKSLAKFFRVPKTQIAIIKGAKSRKKIIEI